MWTEIAIFVFAVSIAAVGSYFMGWNDALTKEDDNGVIHGQPWEGDR